ncbi:hypothetical protein [Persicobacter diffluens]
MNRLLIPSFLFLFLMWTSCNKNSEPQPNLPEIPNFRLDQQTIVYTFDGVENQIDLNYEYGGDGASKLLSVSGGDYQMSLAYESASNLVKRIIEITVDGAKSDFSCSYDNRGRIIKMTGTSNLPNVLNMDFGMSKFFDIGGYAGGAKQEHEYEYKFIYNTSTYFPDQVNIYKKHGTSFYEESTLDFLYDQGSLKETQWQDYQYYGGVADPRVLGSSIQAQMEEVFHPMAKLPYVLHFFLPLAGNIYAISSIKYSGALRLENPDVLFTNTTGSGVATQINFALQDSADAEEMTFRMRFNISSLQD